VITLPKPDKGPEFPPKLGPISLLSMMGKLFEKVLLKIVHRHIEGKGFLKPSQFGFRACHSMT
jgi:hypothetical protein